MLIEPLTRAHNRKSFDCGEAAVNLFFQRQSMQDQEHDLSRTMVLIGESKSTRVIGFHTMVMSQVRQEEIPNDRPRIKRGIPVILLGQLGIDKEFQGRGLGDLMLIDVQSRVHEISRKIGVRALMLDARNKLLADWYEKHDFVRFPDSFRMFKSIQAIRKLLE